MADSREVIFGERVRETLNDIDGELRSLKSRIPLLEVQRGVLLRLLDEAKVVPIASDNGRDEPLQGPTGAVLSFVGSHPGVTITQIVEYLRDRIESESSNRKQVIYTVVSQLRRRGRLYAGEDGRHYIRPEEYERPEDYEEGPGDD